MNAKDTITPVILSGGQGTRLWPLSRSDKPKQFIPLTSNTSLFEETAQRCDGYDGFADKIIICSQAHRFLIKKLLSKEQLQSAHIIMEPCGRNTAAAIAIAALAAKTPDDILLIMPSDHFIPDNNAFYKDIEKALPLAADGHLVTFGIQPTSAHTGFGYIQAGEATGNGFAIKAFHEKPDAQKAQTYLEQGGFYWNAGIFMAKAGMLMGELEKHASDILDQTREAWDKRQDDLGDTLINPESFAKVRSDSIDYAIAEKTDRAAVIPTSFDWNDLGHWKSLWSASEKDAHNNAAQGTVYTHDVKNSYLRSDGPVLGVLGLDNVIAVAMKDAVFIAAKDRSEDIKHLVSDMKFSQQMQIHENPFTMRPWGSYEIMDEKPGFKVKKLIIDPECRLSLQKHEHRSEHWVVVKGTATITRGSEIFDLKANESVYIPCGTVHRLENKQAEPLEIIEVQTGDYLGEDDIIRLEDDYNRLETTDKKKAAS